MLSIHLHRSKFGFPYVAIRTLDEEIRILEHDIDDTRNKIRVDLGQLLLVRHTELSEVEAQTETRLSQLRTQKPLLNVELEKVIAAKEGEERRKRNKLDKEHKNDRFRIMRENKGKYTFSWKNERRSWQAAESIIYFDIGEDYLF